MANLFPSLGQNNPQLAANLGQIGSQNVNSLLDRSSKELQNILTLLAQQRIANQEIAQREKLAQQQMISNNIGFATDVINSSLDREERSKAREFDENIARDRMSLEEVKLGLEERELDLRGEERREARKFREKSDLRADEEDRRQKYALFRQSFIDKGMMPPSFDEFNFVGPPSSSSLGPLGTINTSSSSDSVNLDSINSIEMIENQINSVRNQLNNSNLLPQIKTSLNSQLAGLISDRENILRTRNEDARRKEESDFNKIIETAKLLKEGSPLVGILGEKAGIKIPNTGIQLSLENIASLPDEDYQKTVPTLPKDEQVQVYRMRQDIKNRPIQEESDRLGLELNKEQLKKAKRTKEEEIQDELKGQDLGIIERVKRGDENIDPSSFIGAYNRLTPEQKEDNSELKPKLNEARSFVRQKVKVNKSIVETGKDDKGEKVELADKITAGKQAVKDALSSYENKEEVINKVKNPIVEKLAKDLKVNVKFDGFNKKEIIKTLSDFNDDLKRVNEINKEVGGKLLVPKFRFVKTLHSKFIKLMEFGQGTEDEINAEIEDAIQFLEGSSKIRS